jgi:hypothetical protein
LGNAFPFPFLFSLRTILTIIVGMLALSVQAQEIYTGAIAISPSVPTNSWRPTNTLAPGDSAKLSITVAQSGSYNGRNYTLHGNPIQHPPISSPPGSIIWRGNYSSLHACNAGNSPGTTTATVTAEWVETSSGGEGGGGSPSIISGEATGIAQADIPVFSWSFDQRMQYADGTSPITYTVTGSIAGRRVTMSAYSVKPLSGELSVTNNTPESTNIRTGKITSTNSSKSKMGVYYGERELARSTNEIAFAKVDLIIPPGPGSSGGTPLPEDRQPAGGTAPATNELNPGTFVLLYGEDQTNRVATTLTLKADPTGGSVTLDQHGLTDLKIYTNEALQQELPIPKTWTNGETSPTTLYMVGSSSSTNLQSAQGTLDLTYKANLAADGGEYSIKDTVGVTLLPIEFEVKHIEKERDADGNETQTVVNSGPDTMLRDEIVDIRIKVPPIGTTDWTVDLTVEPEAMRNQNLPGRGDVKMYDFGQVETSGTVTPDKTQFVLQASAGGERTIRAVLNKEGKLKIKMKSTDGKLDFTSPEYTIKERVRKYAVPYPGFPNHDPNKYDQQFVDGAKHWGDFYGHPIDTVDRLKAISVAESNVGAFVQNKAARPHDILTIGHPDDNVLETIQGEPKQWDLDLAHPKKPAADPRYRKLNYPEANISSTREAIKWGTLWLYVKGFGLPANIQANPNWTYEKRNQAPHNVIDGIEEPEFCFTGWSSWDYATGKYNGGGVDDYMTRVNNALQKGLHWNAGGNNKLWPIRADKSGRP